MSRFSESISRKLQDQGISSPAAASAKELYEAVSYAAMSELAAKWAAPKKAKRACYLSAEFLVGRLIYSNLLNLGLLDECNQYLQQNGIDATVFEQIEDDALGNGGLGRLAACFLDSAATHSLPLDGFGLRYRYGLFQQYFDNGFQRERPDDWTRFGDPWSIRRESESVKVSFADQDVMAVPYDMPVIGYGGECVNTLRLWQAEPVKGFDFDAFNSQKYEEAVRERDRAEMITAVLYPNDDTDEGKRLRLKQQYFFSSATMQTLVSRYVERHGNDFSHFAAEYAVQLNDTHPVVAIPELLRLLCGVHGLSFENAFAIACDTFAYTNHTIMAEALEKWDVRLFLSVIPEVYPYVVMVQNHLRRVLDSKGIQGNDQGIYNIISDGRIHMARLAIYASHSTNGVAKIHTEIIKSDALPEWYRLYPERFNNKTNGITQRRWLALCNRELAAFASNRVGKGWLKELTDLKGLEKYANDVNSLRQLQAIKKEKKNQLAAYVWKHDHFALNTDFIFDIQVKRLHEYKRQLLNAFSILDIYFGIKDGSIKDFQPTTFLFGAKAAPGYYRAKGIIKFINEVAKLVNYDDEVNRKMQVLFVQDYNVSYAEKLIPAADISEQISTAGTEASGTSNMKFMLNGAVTLGTLDGANIEIVDRAGRENNYIFGATVEEINEKKASYNPRKLYESEPRIRRVVDTLVDGTLDDGGTGMFRELYDAPLKGASWHQPDHYFLLLDFLPYCEARLRVNRDYADRDAFARKCLMNIANAGEFSSDRTIRQYADEIWHIKAE